MRPVLGLVPVLLAGTACVSVGAIHPVVPAGASIDEPRLLGDWRLVSGRDTTFVAISRPDGTDSHPGAGYLLTFRNASGDTVEMTGRLGPFGPDSWVLELTPALTNVPEGLREQVLPLHTQVVMWRTTAGLDFAVFNTDSIRAALEGGQLQTPHTWADDGVDRIVLTGESADLRAALAGFATRPGALVRLTRVGRDLILPEVP